jgi:NADH:ubiquinone reductase (H+-translocating)
MLKKEALRVVIVGAGFAGLAAAKALAKANVSITLIDRTNHHLFQPLLYQVATAALAAPDISAPIRKLLSRQRNVTVWMATVERIDVEKKLVMVDGQRLGFDYLILAAGMRQAYFGHDDWAAFAPGLKTLGEALDIRRRILRAFEAAEREPSPESRRASSWLGRSPKLPGARWRATFAGSTLRRPAWC